MKKAPSPPKRGRLFLVGAILVSISVAFSLLMILRSLSDPELGYLVLGLVVMVSPVIILGIILVLIGNHRSKPSPIIWIPLFHFCLLSQNKVVVTPPILFGRGYVFDGRRGIVSWCRRFIGILISETEVPFSNIVVDKNISVI